MSWRIVSGAAARGDPGSSGCWAASGVAIRAEVGQSGIRLAGFEEEGGEHDGEERSAVSYQLSPRRDLRQVDVAAAEDHADALVSHVELAFEQRRRAERARSARRSVFSRSHK